MSRIASIRRVRTPFTTGVGDQATAGTATAQAVNAAQPPNIVSLKRVIRIVLR
jgi:hypothetical protein